MRYKEILCEARTAPLYHGSPLCTLLKIILTDTLLPNRSGFISLSRSYHVADYFDTYESYPDYGGILVLDQARLTERYRIEPVHDASNLDSHAYRDEDEERLFRPVRPLSPYVLSINFDPAAIRRAMTDTQYRDDSEDYADHFAGNRKLFQSTIRKLLTHPAANRWQPRLAKPNLGNVDTIADAMKQPEA